ncbi:unnamed protein product [Orchesella dallaii]
MTSLYDSLVRYKGGDSNDNDNNLTLTFDFGGICGAYESDPNNPEFNSETEWLSLCLGLSLNKQKVILMHPVAQLFLYLKWKKIRALLWLSILYHILWLTFYTYFNVNLYIALCPYQQTMPNSTDRKIHCDAWNQHSRLVVEISILLLMTISIALKEVYELHHSREFKMYFKAPENIGQWLVLGIVVLISITIFVADADEEKINLPEWQYQAAAFGILLSCFLCMCQIGKIPKFGIYMLILAKVVKSFAMFIITFAVILVAFMLSLQILMPEKDEFNDNPWSLIRLLSMMSGEINYDDLFHDQPDDIQLPFPISTKLLFAVFISIVTLILCNLLIGLTVSDIQSLQNDAALHSLSIQVEEIHLMESFLMSHSVQKLFRKFGKHSWLRYFLVTQHHDDSKTSQFQNMQVDVSIGEIPKYLRSKLKRLAAKNFHGYDSYDYGDECESNKDSCSASVKDSCSASVKETIEDDDKPEL